MTQQVISDWNGASGGSRDNYPEFLAKSKANFAELYAGFGPIGGQVSFVEDFLGPTLTTKLAVIAGSDSPAAGAISAALGGTLVLTTGDSNASLAADGVQVSGSLNWKATNGGLTFVTKLQASAITALQLFVGLTDQVAALEMPVTLSVVTFTTVASDAVGFLFDTTATTDTIRLVGVAADVDATMQDTANAWAATTYTEFKIVIDTAGTATFYINGVQQGTAMLLAVTPGTVLAPVICARSLAANSKTITIDTLGLSMNRV